MKTDQSTRVATAALADAATLAGSAPSIHNTQPWRWRVRADTAELYAEPTRQLSTTDPSGRLMVISCGAALHHLRVALAANGWSIDVSRLPEPAHPQLLARVRAVRHGIPDPVATRLRQSIRVRRTDRRPLTDIAIAAEDLDAIRTAVQTEKTWLQTLRHSDIIKLAEAADRAQTLESFDAQWRAEIGYWAGGTRTVGLGVPDSVIPREPSPTTVASRDFGHAGTLSLGAGSDGAAVYAVMAGATDTPLAWLRGEALSHAWLVAVDRGVSLLPMSAAIEVASTRLILRRLIGGDEPYLVLRLGSPTVTASALRRRHDCPPSTSSRSCMTPGPMTPGPTDSGPQDSRVAPLSGHLPRARWKGIQCL